MNNRFATKCLIIHEQFYEFIIYIMCEIYRFK